MQLNSNNPKQNLQDGKTVLKYRDLIATFEGLLTKMCAEEKITFPTTLGVNAFRGFLNEFMQQRLKRRSLSMKSNIIKVGQQRPFFITGNLYQKRSNQRQNLNSSSLCQSNFVKNFWSIIRCFQLLQSNFNSSKI